MVSIDTIMCEKVSIDAEELWLNLCKDRLSGSSTERIQTFLSSDKRFGCAIYLKWSLNNEIFYLVSWHKHRPREI